MKARNRQQLSAHFWSKIEKQKPSHCWKWKGAHFSTGYAMFHVDRKPIQAARFLLKEMNGRIVNFALHRCDNAWCVNPAHIYDGTQQQNMDDRMKRGIYHTRFNGHKRAKVVGAKLKEFKRRIKSGEKPFCIAPDFGIHGATACKLAKQLFQRSQADHPNQRTKQ